MRQIYHRNKSDEKNPEKIKLLVIDDNRDLASDLHTLFNHLDYSIFLAFDEKQAMVKINRIKPDLVFCNIGLPNRGAYKIAYKIRSDYSLCHIFLVGLTYRNHERFKLIAMELGFDAYLSKPVQPTLLDNILRKVEIKKSACVDNTPLRLAR